MKLRQTDRRLQTWCGNFVGHLRGSMREAICAEPQQTKQQTNSSSNQQTCCMSPSRAFQRQHHSGGCASVFRSSLSVVINRMGARVRCESLCEGHRRPVVATNSASFRKCTNITRFQRQCAGGTVESGANIESHRFPSHLFHTN
jgi:hypothetical protein